MTSRLAVVKMKHVVFIIKCDTAYYNNKILKLSFVTLRFQWFVSLR